MRLFFMNRAGIAPTEKDNHSMTSTKHITAKIQTLDKATTGKRFRNILAKIRVGTGVTTIGSGVITQGDVVISNAQLADSSVTSDKIDWTTQTYSVTLGQHIESYSEVTVKSFGGIATIKGFLVTSAVVAQGEALFTISNCPDALKNQRISTTGATGIPYYYIDYDGKAFYDIGTVPVGNILFGVTFI